MVEVGGDSARPSAVADAVAGALALPLLLRWRRRHRCRVHSWMGLRLSERKEEQRLLLLQEQEQGRCFREPLDRPGFFSFDSEFVSSFFRRGKKLERKKTSVSLSRELLPSLTALSVASRGKVRSSMS